MDSKELILVVFGILMLVVLVHGLWVAWRKNQKNLKFEMVDSVVQEDPDDIGPVSYTHLTLPTNREV